MRVLCEELSPYVCQLFLCCHVVNGATSTFPKSRSWFHGNDEVLEECGDTGVCILEQGDHSPERTPHHSISRSAIQLHEGDGYMNLCSMGA